MVDTRTPIQRSKIMSSVGTKDTGPEMRLRRVLHSAGFRYRLHPKNLPGRPDIVFPARRKVIFVHGCFWHAHGCTKGRPPKSKAEYWGPKLAANKDRDVRRIHQLRELGWRSLTVWQCELADPVAVLQRVQKFLDNGLKSDRHKRK
ncbi:MAG: DNA mismatch endonuclease Vsr [Sphingomicrobium sp.]